MSFDVYSVGVDGDLGKEIMEHPEEPGIAVA
jgi:hypothetical protein